jgi:magnesium transporter
VTDTSIEPDLAPKGDAIRDARGHLSAAFIAEVEKALAAGDAVRLRTLAGELHEADVGELIGALDVDERPKLIRLLGDDFDFAALTEIDDTVRAQILEGLPSTEVAEGVRDLESDDAVTILEDLHPEDQADVLAQIPQTERVALSRVLEYPEESAGRLMQTDFVAVPPFWNVGETIDYLRDSTELPDEFYEILMVDADNKPTGTVALYRVLRNQRPVRISTIADGDIHPVRDTADQEDVARTFERYNLISAPVIDAGGRLVGVITVDDIVDVIEQEADEDLMALGGVRRHEELSDSVWMVTRSRFGWLLVNLFTAILASAVIGLFQGQLQKMVALAVLMPIVASQGGNAATQTMTIAVRAIATRELSPRNVARVIGRELLVGILNGIAFAAIMGVIAYVWFRVPDLGVIIGLAMIVNLIAAALGGILIPLGLNWLRADPAVASGAFVTTVTDLVGFFSFLGIAAVWFGPR